jgi:hypothetical protein
MKLNAFLIFFLIPCILKAQSDLPKKKINLSIGRSIHGSGDIRGVLFSTEYSKQVRRKLSYTMALSGSIHNGEWPLFFYAPNGEYTDGSIRYTTAGMQFSMHYGFNFIKASKHELIYRMGGVLRYQSSSYYDAAEVLYPALTGLRVPVIVFNHSTPQNTIAVGGSAQLLYNYTLKNNITLGSLAGFQIDSNGDVISQISLTIGKRF